MVHLTFKLQRTQLFKIKVEFLGGDRLVLSKVEHAQVRVVQGLVRSKSLLGIILQQGINKLESFNIGIGVELLEGRLLILDRRVEKVPCLKLLVLRS